jgi:hypothetical protein
MPISMGFRMPLDPHPEIYEKLSIPPGFRNFFQTDTNRFLKLFCDLTAQKTFVNL